MPLTPYRPLNVPLMQQELRALAELDFNVSEVRNGLLQIAEELPYWSLTQEAIHLNPNRAQFMLARFMVLFSGLAALHGLERPGNVNDAGMSEYIVRLARVITASNPPWLPVTQSLPQRGEYVLVRGPSGYTTTPEYCCIARYDTEYRPRDPWVTETNDRLSDGHEEPTHWRHLGSLLDPIP